jgi:sigma-B regulation protein RsbU (phosphoserine phosphatase)
VSIALASFLDDAPCGLVVFDDHGTISDANATLCEWLGLMPNDLMRKHVEVIFPAGGKIFFQTHLFPLLRMAGYVDEVYFALRGQDGEDLPVLISASRRVQDGVGASLAVLVRMKNREQFEDALLTSLRDAEAAREEGQQHLSQLTLLNEQLEARNLELARIEDELRRSNTVKDEFLGLVSHELRSPLAAISGAVSLLARRLDELDPATVGELLKDMEDESARLFRLIEDMLIVARSEVATQQVELEPVLLQRIVERVVVRQAQEHPAAKLELRIAEELSPVLGAEGFAEQIVRTFITNAIKYGSPGAPIAVDVRGAGSAVAVTVGNAGVEFSEAEIARIFEPFYRDDRHRDVRQGLGLGLTVCQRLAAAQGGTVSARPRPGGGLEISFALPAIDAHGAGSMSSGQFRNTVT